jgi:hypothetical protein
VLPAPQLSINLLDQDTFSQSAIGKVLLWALSIGRYIVVFTELIVILSFLSRFKLDRDLTDLNEAIAKQKAIIQSYGDLEVKFRRTQDQIAYIKENSLGIAPKTMMDIVGQTLPPDVKINQLAISSNQLRVSALSLSPEGFVQFIKAFQQHPQVQGITIGSVKSEDRGISMEFDLIAVFREQ